MANTQPGAWGMRGPQNKLHFYPLLRNAVDLSARAICGVLEASFAYSVTKTPDATAPCCGRCVKQRGGRL
jgi:hypothetical protein